MPITSTQDLGGPVHPSKMIDNGTPQDCAITFVLLGPGDEEVFVCLNRHVPLTAVMHIASGFCEMLNEERVYVSLDTIMNRYRVSRQNPSCDGNLQPVQEILHPYLRDQILTGIIGRPQLLEAVPMEEYTVPTRACSPPLATSAPTSPSSVGSVVSVGPNLISQSRRDYQNPLPAQNTLRHEAQVHLKPRNEPHIPRPRNKWILYRMHKSQELRKTNPDLKTGDISRLVSQLWSNESSDVQMFWAEKAKEEELEHKRKYPNYRYRARRHRKLGGR
ncbi:hypothetical protein MKZ38_010027 [Zalerion maritima]|uniref:HMG box domain-containing protein n=1 Tax=Zalerion maritima TaxID=339359 RepID=A0AAD5RSQ2_9PEZI|nr:hypothetical protein MKZ38_010027 [Zalerion maritima]